MSRGAGGTANGDGVSFGVARMFWNCLGSGDGCKLCKYSKTHGILHLRW